MRELAIIRSPSRFGWNDSDMPHLQVYDESGKRLGAAKELLEEWKKTEADKECT